MKKILLIEDNNNIRENIAEILELADYEVAMAVDGKEGVEMAKSNVYDLILCDIMMPKLDGYGVLKILNRNPDTLGIPFIFLTAKAEKFELRKGMVLGADDYITKPFEESDLLDAVAARLLKSTKLKNQYEESLEGLNEFMFNAKGLESLKLLHTDQKIRTYKAKEVIYREDEYANYLYFIVKGKIQTIKTDGFNKSLVNDVYRKGDFLAYMSLLDGNEHFETAVAMEDSDLAIIPKQDFLNLINHNRAVSSKFIKMLSKNVREKEIRLLQLAYSPVRERVIETLINLLKNNSNKNPQTIEISRTDMANIVGTAKETLIRTLSQLNKEGLINLNGKIIIIENLEDLITQNKSFN